MSPEQARLVDALRDAEGAYRRGLLNDATPVVEAATALLVAGMDPPGVISLAGDDRAPESEVLRDLDQTANELGLQPMSVREALIRAPRWVARALLDGTISASKAAHLAYDSEVVDESRNDITAFALEALDHPCPANEADLRATAQALMDTPLPPEFAVTGRQPPTG